MQGVVVDGECKAGLRPAIRLDTCLGETRRPKWSVPAGRDIAQLPAQQENVRLDVTCNSFRRRRLGARGGGGAWFIWGSMTTEGSGEFADKQARRGSAHLRESVNQSDSTAVIEGLSPVYRKTMRCSQGQFPGARLGACVN